MSMVSCVCDVSEVQAVSDVVVAATCCKCPPAAASSYRKSAVALTNISLTAGVLRAG